MLEVEVLIQIQIEIHTSSNSSCAYDTDTHALHLTSRQLVPSLDPLLKIVYQDPLCHLLPS